MERAIRMFDNPSLLQLHQLIGYLVASLVSLICYFERQRRSGSLFTPLDAGGHKSRLAWAQRHSSHWLQREKHLLSSTQGPTTSFFFQLVSCDFHSFNMHVPARPLGSVCGYSVRPSASLYADYGSTPCSVSPSKPSMGKAFTIDALLSKPDTIAREKTSLSTTVKYPSTLGSVYPVHGQMHSSLPHYMYSPSMVHTQPGYPVYYCPPYGYQAACRGPLYAQGK